MESELIRFLTFMKNTPCVETGLAPAELVLKQFSRTKLSMLKLEYNKIQKFKDTLKEISNYDVRESVFAEATGYCEVKWWPGKILEEKGPLPSNLASSKKSLRKSIFNDNGQSSSVVTSNLQESVCLRRYERTKKMPNRLGL